MAESLAADLLEDGGGEVGGGLDIPVSEGGREGNVEGGSEDRRAPQGYQHGSGAGGWSTAQVQQLVEATVTSILNGMGKGIGKGFGKGNEVEGESKVLLEERFFRNMDKFEDSLEGWNGWVFNLSTQIGGVSRKVAQLVERVLSDKDIRL